MGTIAEHVTRMRESAPHPTKDNRFLVLPNDTAAYARMGSWGIYDTKRGLWINFRDTELEAYQLLVTLLHHGDPSVPHPWHGFTDE